MRAGKAVAFGVALAAVIAGAGAVAVSRVDPMAVKDFLSNAVRQATGRELLVRGATELRLFPSPTLIAENVIFGNAPWSASPDMARVKRLEARIAFLPLFAGQLRVSRFRLLEPHVLLERDKQGRRNWDFESPAGASGESAFLTQMQSQVRMLVSEVQIVDGSFSYRDPNGTRTLKIPNLSATGDVAAGSLNLAGDGLFNGRAWKLEGSVGELSTLLRNEAYDLAFVLSTKGTKLSGEGLIEHPLDGTGLSMKLELAARRASEMLALAGLKVDLPGAVEGSATLSGVDGALRLDAIKVKVAIKGGSLSVSGSVDDLASLRGVQLAVAVKARSVDGIARAAGIDLPKAGPLHASARITNPKGRLRMDKLIAHLQLKGASLKLTGKLNDLVRARGLDLGVALETSSLARLSRYLGVPLPATGPVSATARLSRTKHGYKIAKLDVKVGASDAHGELFVYPHRKRPKLVGSLESKHLDLDQLLPATRQRGGKRVFSSQPFSFAWLRDFDGELSVHARKLKIRSMWVDRARVGMSLQQGRLRFTPAGTLGGGTFKANLSVDARTDRPKVAMRIRGKGIGLGKVSSQIYKAALVEGARSDVNIDVAGRGRSVAEIMAGLSGGIYVATGKSTIHNERLEQASSDVVTAILSTVAMQNAEDESTHVRCGVVRVLVTDGLVSVDRSIAMETSRTAMSASGTIDLRDESLDLGVNLVGRKGPSFGVGSFSGLVRVGGTMAEPNVVADAAGIAGAAATVAGAVVTSGLSLLAQGIISQFAADRSTCRTALEIDHSGGSGKAKFIRAGSRDEEPLESSTGTRDSRRNTSTVTPKSAFARTADDGN